VSRPGGERAAGSWVAIGAPLDSAAAGEGEERAPQALRAAGLIERIGARDLGDVARPLRPPERDERTGIVAFEALVEASEAIAAYVAAVIEASDHPLVLGGDCSLLIGAIAGARRSGRAPGLLFVDGHADYWDGDTSPTGESADMELAILHGDGPVELAGEEPLLDPARTAILGHRQPELHPDVAAERERVPAAVLQLDAPAIRELGPAAAAELARERAGPERWLHLDLDSLDERALPAVSYPQAGGLGWDELEALLAPMLAAGVLGASVADLNSDLDPDGVYAARVCELLGDLLAQD
jgi:arginase